MSFAATSFIPFPAFSGAFFPGLLQKGAYYTAYLWLCLSEEDRVASFYPAASTAAYSAGGAAKETLPPIPKLLQAVRQEMERYSPIVRL